MPVARALAEFKASVTQCESLIANAHRTDPTGIPFLPAIDQAQITVAAFLNMFIAWEKFLKSSLSAFMAGAPTTTGTAPVRYVMPRTVEDAIALIVGVLKYFDYANHDNVRKMASIYFENGYLYEPHLSSIFLDLTDMKTMRNASAHKSSTTQTALESLARRIFGRPQPGITLYQLLTAVDPRSPAGDTVFLACKRLLVVTAELIASG